MDRHRFEADTDPDPAFYFNADPDPDFHFNADPDPASLRLLVNGPSRAPY